MSENGGKDESEDHRDHGDHGAGGITENTRVGAGDTKGWRLRTCSEQCHRLHAMSAPVESHGGLFGNAWGAYDLRRESSPDN